MDERIDDRLWQGALPPDLELVRARAASLPLPPEPDWSAPRVVRPSARAFERPAAWLALAAAFVAVFGLAWVGRDAWRVETVAGRPSLTGFAFANRVFPGGVLTTDASSLARLHLPQLGDVTLEPQGCVQRERDEGGRRRLQLVRGTVHANLDGPPRRFAFDTKAGSAVDLGGAYTLVMSDAGEGRLDVTRGRVMFESGGIESYLPAGVWCALTSAGAGAPRRADAGDAFLAAVAVTDNPACQADDFAPLLEKAKASDAITLWHLLPRVQGKVRRQVAERFASLVDVPHDVTLDQVLALDPAALAAWWNALGLGSLEKWSADGGRPRPRGGPVR